MHYKRSMILLLPFLFLSFAYDIKAQETKGLTLTEAIDLGVRNSKQLQLSKARIDEAIAATREATQKRLPDANIGVNFMEFSNAKVKSYGKDSTAIAPLGINQVIYGTATVSYPVFTGFKFKFGIESAKFLEQASKLDADHDKQEVILNTVAAYVNLYKANIAAKLVEENLEQSRQRD